MDKTMEGHAAEAKTEYTISQEQYEALILTNEELSE